MSGRCLLLLLGGSLGLPAGGAAQGYRLRLESRVDAATYRGVRLDSILAAQALIGTDGGFVTPDGFAVDCSVGDYCRFYRPGPERRGGPLVSRADLLLWGLGVPGLTVRVQARHATDLARDDVWPGTRPALQLVEGFAEYRRGMLVARAGRQLLTGRLGVYGFDGARVAFDFTGQGLDAAVYGGWGLARGTALPVTSPALNPLDDFQPRNRQLVAGAELGWRTRLGDVRGEYRREVDPATDYFVSERVALSLSAQPKARLHLLAAGDWDLAMGQLGSAEARATYTTALGSASVGARRYRPYFDLWTIWGAFSPVPYTAWSGVVTARPLPVLSVSLRGETYRYDDTGADAPLVATERSGWRWNLDATWTPNPRWTVEAGTHRELGPGAASRGVDGRVSWRPDTRVAFGLEGGWLERPLEFRFSEADVRWIGAEIEARPSAPWNLSLRVARFDEARDRPDPAAFNWDQFRVTARVSLLLRSNADRVWLPPRLGAPGGDQ